MISRNSPVHGLIIFRLLRSSSASEQRLLYLSSAASNIAFVDETRRKSTPRSLGLRQQHVCDYETNSQIRHAERGMCGDLLRVTGGCSKKTCNKQYTVDWKAERPREERQQRLECMRWNEIARRLPYLRNGSLKGNRLGCVFPTARRS